MLRKANGIDETAIVPDHGSPAASYPFNHKIVRHGS